jgi:hypothetical protein
MTPDHFEPGKFLICLDYETALSNGSWGSDEKVVPISVSEEIALTLRAGSLPPIGQHAPSIAFDQDLLLFDNGQESQFQNPRGAQRYYASPRKYRLDLVGKVATEMWNYPMNESIHCPFAEAYMRMRRSTI